MSYDASLHFYHRKGIEDLKTFKNKQASERCDLPTVVFLKGNPLGPVPISRAVCASSAMSSLYSVTVI